MAPLAAAAVVEIDFLGLAPPPITARVEHRHRRTGAAGSSIRDIQKAVSRMDPDVLRSLIARNDSAGNENNNKNIAAPFPPPKSPFFSSSSPTTSASDIPAAANPNLAPLTIFYDGAVTVFDVPPGVADLIIKTAETSSSLATASAVSSERAMAETLVFDAPLSGLPLARKKSLRRFLQKRQQRLTSAPPYTSASSSSTATPGDRGEVVAAAAQDNNHWAALDARGWWPNQLQQNGRSTSISTTTSTNASFATAAATNVNVAW